MVSKDQMLIAGITNGNKQIINRFRNENIYYIKNYILRNCGNMEDVEDIFQDALVILYQKMCADFLDIHVPIKTYFYGICKNLWLNRLRKKNNSSLMMKIVWKNR